MEGKYWKRRIETVVEEYKRWRAFFMEKVQIIAIIVVTDQIENFEAFFISFTFSQLRQSDRPGLTVSVFLHSMVWSKILQYTFVYQHVYTMGNGLKSELYSNIWVDSFSVWAYFSIKHENIRMCVSFL